jgi:hypothetical protein
VEYNVLYHFFTNVVIADLKNHVLGVGDDIGQVLT